MNFDKDIETTTNRKVITKSRILRHICNIDNYSNRIYMIWNSQYGIHSGYNNILSIAFAFEEPISYIRKFDSIAVCLKCFFF